MENPSPPPPVGFPVTLSSPGTRPEQRLAAPTFSSPVPTRFSPQRPQQDQLPKSVSRTPSSLSSGDGVQASSPIPLFSTPPGPPIFSSPVRPAAVPFCTSPATPQPLAFSPASSLPTSSPPHFSNGSTELPLHHSANVDESKFESPYVFFSAHKVPCFTLFLIVSCHQITYTMTILWIYLKRLFLLSLSFLYM